MNTEVMFSSKTDEWETPQWLFDKLQEQYGEFTLDVCATRDNKKCRDFYSRELDGLKHSWQGEICWMNPPYGDPEYPCKPNCKKKCCKERGYHNQEYKPGIIDWVKKADEEAQKGECVVFALLPARTDTKWFHDHIYKKYAFSFIKGRLKFGGCKNSAPFPSMVVIFRGEAE